MKTQDYTKKFSYVGQNFREWFYDMTVSKPKKSKLFSKKLPRSMTDKEIFDELNPTEVSLGEMFATLEDKKTFYLFYIKDKAGVLRAVRVGWSGVGWCVDAYSVGYPYAWLGGDQVFSRNSFDSKLSSLNTLTPSHFESLEKRIEKLEKLFNPDLLANNK